MHASLLNLLVDPISKQPLTRAGDALCGTDGRRFPIINGIPRFVLTTDAGQRQTERSFGYQWKRREAYDTQSVRDFGQEWLVRRYGFASASEMRAYFAARGRVLDAGCGGGYTAALWLAPEWRGEWIGADISEAVDVAAERLRDIPGTHFLQADILQLPFPAESFDVVFSEGVLHHTPSTERALKSLVPLLRPGGEIMFYVYRKKGPLREFADDHIREVISALPPDQAWEALIPLTKLGQSLAELHAEVEVKEAIPYLGIPAGKYDVQRLIYWNFAKMFWNEKLPFDANQHMNFDWYSPRYSFRQTESEVRQWCADCSLRITRFETEDAGFTVRALKG